MRRSEYTSFAARARYRALKKTGGVVDSFRTWARKTYAEAPVMGKLEAVVGRFPAATKNKRAAGK